MKIFFVGLPFFGKKLVHDLNRFGSKHSFTFYDTYYSKAQQLKFAAALPFADLVISMNGVSDKSGSLDLVLKMKKKLWLQWQGSDVLLALESTKNNTIKRKYIDYATHFTDAPWMRDELRQIGISCELIHFKWVGETKLTDKFKDVSAYSYLPSGNETFYGWKTISLLAEKNPAINFYIAGSKGDGLGKFANVTFLGWISEFQMKELRERTPICLRLPQHDGYSFTTIEALSCGSEVIWTMPHLQCHFLKAGSNPDDLFKTVVEKLRAGNLARNLLNIQFVKNNFSYEKVMEALIKKIEEIGGK